MRICRTPPQGYIAPCYGYILVLVMIAHHAHTHTHNKQGAVNRRIKSLHTTHGNSCQIALRFVLKYASCFQSINQKMQIVGLASGLSHLMQITWKLHRWTSLIATCTGLSERRSGVERFQLLHLEIIKEMFIKMSKTNCPWQLEVTAVQWHNFWWLRVFFPFSFEYLWKKKAAF